VILDHAYMTLPYFDASILFLSGWLRKEGIAIERALKIDKELADDDNKLHDRLATLEDTYSKAQMKSKGTKGCSKFLNLNLVSLTKSANPERSTNVFPENWRHDNAPASNLVDSCTHSDWLQFPQPPR
jgi:hypothetical protein